MKNCRVGIAMRLGNTRLGKGMGLGFVLGLDFGLVLGIACTIKRCVECNVLYAQLCVYNIGLSEYAVLYFFELYCTIEFSDLYFFAFSLALYSTILPVTSV